MNILLLNTHNPLREAGIVAFDIFNQFIQRGHKVRLLVNSYNSHYPEGIVSVETSLSYWGEIILAKFEWRLNKIKKILRLKEKSKPDPDYCFFQLKEQKLVYKTKTLLRKAKIKPDVIIVLFAKNFINIKNIYELNKITSAPIFWIMFDMAPFTGGCHYAWECKGYLNSCGNCPGLFSTNSYDVSYNNLLYKKKYIDKTNIHLIAASEWQYRQAKVSSLFKNKIIHKILLSIDSSVFKPTDKEEIKSKLGIPANKKVVFFGSVVLTQKRKGMCYLLESLRILKEKTKGSDSGLDDNILLLIAGMGIDRIVESLPFNFHYLGKLTDTYEIASAYQAADVFICPSIEDSGPMMINQSLMCGTPVVSFEMGVAPDLIISGQTGYIAKLKDSADMAQGLYNVLSLDMNDCKRISDNCRELALKLCSPEVRMNEIEKIIEK
jgi:glycosyltransferase involved in cell wall biosynthesis